MIELAALCVVVVVCIYLLPLALTLIGYLLYGAVMFCAYMIATPFYMAWMILVGLAHLVAWVIRQLSAAAINPGWRQSFLRMLDTVGSTGIKAYRLAQRLAAR